MTPVSGDFSRGRVSLIILRLGLPMMLAEFVHVLYNDGSCDLEKMRIKDREEMRNDHC